MVRILSRGTSSQRTILRRELPPEMLLVDVVLRANLFPLQHKVQRRGAIMEALFRISEGYYFGPHHLIMAALLHFEEKVHTRRLARADSIPLLFPRLLCHVLAHMGFPTDPRSEPRRHCRESFSLDQWTQIWLHPGPQNFPSQGKSLCRPLDPPRLVQAASSMPHRCSSYIEPLITIPGPVSCLAHFFPDFYHYSNSHYGRMDHFRLQGPMRLSFSVRFSTTSIFHHQLHL
ncbi:hypothetical protein AAG906_026386 [Vitis piasezkii]